MAGTDIAESSALEQAQQQLRALIEEIGSLAERETDSNAFFARLATCAATALGAWGSAVWLNRSLEEPFLAAHYLRPKEGLDSLITTADNLQLVQQVFASPATVVLAPGSSRADGRLVNRSEFLLLLVPIYERDQFAGVLQVFQRGDADRTAHPGFVAYGQRLCELAGTYLRNCRLREIEARQAIASAWADFHRAAHFSLRSKDVCGVLANEGRRLLDADRVSVAIQRRGRLRIVAVSGQERIDRRAPVVEQLEELAAAVSKTKEEFWQTGVVQELSPQIEVPLQEYLDLAQPRVIGIVPLRRPVPDADAKRPVIGALIVERMTPADDAAVLQANTRHAASESELALANALTHEGLFLFPLWNQLSKSKTLVSAQQMPKTMLIVAAVAFVALALVMTPWEFEIHANGTLQPTLRRDVFASADGAVDRIFVKHGDRVKAGQLLLTLRNTDLEVAFSDLTGKQAATFAQLGAVDRMLSSEGKRLESEQRLRLSGQRNELLEQLESQREQLELIRQKREQLSVYSSLDGTVVTWDVKELLDQRPVHRGQVLLSVAATSGDWELELQVPEDRMGHLTAAKQEFGEALPVVYRLATDPGHDHLGAIRDVEAVAEIRGESGNTVLVRVQIDRSGLENPRPGADCRGKIQCGKRPLGYVLFYDLWVFVESRVLFLL